MRLMPDSSVEIQVEGKTVLVVFLNCDHIPGAVERDFSGVSLRLPYAASSSVSTIKLDANKPLVVIEHTFLRHWRALDHEGDGLILTAYEKLFADGQLVATHNIKN